MDSKRLILFIALSLGILLLWQNYFAPKPPLPSAAPTAQVAGTNQVATLSEASKLAHGQSISVSTDVLKASIDTVGGDLRELQLTHHNDAANPNAPFTLFTDKDG